MQRDNGCRSPAQIHSDTECFRPASPSIRINWRKPKPRIHANLHGSAKTLLKSLSSPHRRSAARGALLCDRYPPPGGSRSPAPLIRQNRLCRRIALSNNSNVPGQFVATTRRSFGNTEAREWWPALSSQMRCCRRRGIPELLTTFLINATPHNRDPRDHADYNTIVLQALPELVAPFSKRSAEGFQQTLTA